VLRGRSKWLRVLSIIEGTKESLQRLQLEYVDILFAHRPDPSGEYSLGSVIIVRGSDTWLVPIEETVRAFNYVIEKGWVRNTLRECGTELELMEII
jgi:aryl-alcohol dehydrogenase-like predicted oxidoreductase